jgi:hypothetical protein
MTDLRTAAQQALEALDIGYDCAKAEADQFHAAMAGYKPARHAAMDADVQKIAAAITALRAALAQQEKLMPITDDHGQAIKPQYRVIKSTGKWRLLYDQLQVGETTRHEFRITKMTHDIALYPGITLEEAIKRFDERVEADHE